MKIRVRKSADRGHFDFGWLNTYHTFSFGEYHDPAHTHFRALRVINEDFVAPGQGFPTHAHRDMEIVTLILQGELEHKDSMGNGSVIRPGDVQRMSAGTGVSHSEFNPSPKNPAHLLQIWIFPEKKNIAPGYEQTSFSSKIGEEGLLLLASGSPQDGAVKIHQDAGLFHGHLISRGRIVYEPAKGRGLWLHVIAGRPSVGGENLAPGDGAAIEEASSIEISSAGGDCRFLLFDLA